MSNQSERATELPWGPGKRLFNSPLATDYEKLRDQVMMVEAGKQKVEESFQAPQNTVDYTLPFVPPRLPRPASPEEIREHNIDVRNASAEYKKERTNYFAAARLIKQYFTPDVQRELDTKKTIADKMGFLAERFLGEGAKSAKKRAQQDFAELQMPGQAENPKQDRDNSYEVIDHLLTEYQTQEDGLQALWSDTPTWQSISIPMFHDKLSLTLRNVPHFAPLLHDLHLHPESYDTRMKLKTAVDKEIWDFRRLYGPKALEKRSEGGRRKREVEQARLHTDCWEVENESNSA